MCIIAHPDDECAGFGGALALAALEGLETCVVCLTDGQAATFRGAAQTAAELGAIRREEFAAACEVLGITRHEVLDYQDGQLELLNFLEVTEALVKRIRDWRPQVVLTFGGDGGLNTHRDHTMTSAFATAAFHWAGRSNRFPAQLEAGLLLCQPQKLYYLSYNFLLDEREPLCPAPFSAILDVRAVQEIKLRAFRKHTSQLPVMQRIDKVLANYGPEVMEEERYALVASHKPQLAMQETSLFTGVVPDVLADLT